MARTWNSGRAAAGLSLAVFLCGCVTVAEFRDLEAEVAALKADRSQNASGDAARLADLGAQVAALELEVDRLQGDIEESNRDASLARESLAEVQATLAGAPPVSTAPAGSAAPSGSPAPPGSRASDELGAYEEAFRFYRAKDYESAIDRFGKFLQNYPASDYADNALFWMGECYLKLEDHERAVLIFEDVTKRYPKGNKAPDALYRQGIAIIEIGRRTNQEDAYSAAAREIFEKIVRDYPDSDRVPEARSQLEKLSS